MSMKLPQIDPGIVTIGGEDYPICYNMRAAALMESAFERPLMEVLSGFYGIPVDAEQEGEAAPVWQMNFAEQVVLLSCLLAGAGQDPDTDELMRAIHVNERPAILAQIDAELRNKEPRASKKKEMTPMPTSE